MAGARLRIQYASDLHLEFFKETVSWSKILRPVAPILALAGDIGRPDKPSYRSFLEYCAANWRHVFVVTGNHELYNSRASYSWSPRSPPDLAQERLDACAAITASWPNVHLLNRRRVDVDGVAFIGATLWTGFDKEGAEIAHRYMNDYKTIAVHGPNDTAVPLTPDVVSAWHWRDRAWLDLEITACADEGWPTVVITHHLPSHDLIAARYADSPMNVAFASDCSDLIRPPVRAWIAGHTHVGAHRTWRHADGSVTLGAVNPLGYPGESETGYCAEMVVDISAEPGRGGDARDPLLVAAAATEPEMR